MTIFDDIRKDREVGTPGDWSIKDHDPCSAYSGGRHIMSSGGYSDPMPHTRAENEANARRIARVPRLERIALEMEQQIWVKVGEYLAGQPHREVSEKARRGIEAAIKAAFRAACGEGE